MNTNYKAYKHANLLNELKLIFNNETIYYTRNALFMCLNQIHCKQICIYNTLSTLYVWTYGSVCLQLSMDKHGWPHAQKRCQRQDGILLIRSADKQGSIIEKMRQS